MPKTTPSKAERSSADRRRAAALAAAAAHNYTAERVLRALEVIVLNPCTAPAVADAVGVHPRTARRILRTLTREQYVEQRGGRGRSAHKYQPTVRLLAMAAQLALRLPLVQAGRRAVREIEQHTDLTAYVAAPCYGDVLVVACSGERSVRPWATIRASEDAAGRVLLAHRERWRQAIAEAEPDRAMSDEEATRIVGRGFAIIAADDGRIGSQAVPVPSRGEPLAALAVRGRSETLLADTTTLAQLLQGAAARLATTSGAPDGD